MKKKILVICGGKSSEHQVSLDSVRSILSVIDLIKYDVSVLYLNKDNFGIIFNYHNQNLNFDNLNPSYEFCELIPKIKKFDLSLLVLHGEFGEDGVIQTVFDYHNINYTGSKASASYLAMDKYRASLAVNFLSQISIPKTQLVGIKELSKTNFQANIQYPFILKPNQAGSSICVYLINDKNDLENKIKIINKDFSNIKYFIIQEYISDTIELSCGCLQDKDNNFTELLPIEIGTQKGKLFDYDSKYKLGLIKEIIPPVSVDNNMIRKISKLAIQIHQLLGCALYSRSDFLIKRGNIYYLETNTLPGLTKTSLLPQEMSRSGISFSQFIEFIIENSI